MTWIRVALMLMLQGLVFVLLNMATAVFLGAVGIDPAQVFANLTSGNIELGIMLVYIPVVLLLWGLYVTLIARFIKI